MNVLYALYAGVLAVLSLPYMRRRIAIVLTVTLATGLVAPAPVQAQFGAIALTAAINAVMNTINVFLKNLFATANGILESISSLMSQFLQFWRTVVYPESLIAQAKGLAASLIAQFRGLLASLLNINVASARLPNPISLEAIMRNRNASDGAALADAYVRTYRPVPNDGEADPVDRDLIDVDDAAAQAALKTLKASDAVSDQTVAAAMLLEDEAKQLAPGTADYLIAAGIIAAVQNQAVMQKMLAAEMRQEAANLAHRNTMRKRNSAFSSGTRQGITQMLGRR